MFSSNTTQVSNANYIEDVFSTYLYTGNGSSQTITNSVDLSTKGGLVWIKSRSSGVEYHNLFDTARGASNVFFSNTTDASASSPTRLSSFDTTGFTVGSNSATNASSATLVSWTFRKQPKFFDVVTYTGNNSTINTLNHSLGSVPGMIIVKDASTPGNWVVWHRSLGTGGNGYIFLNTTAAAVTPDNGTYWGNNSPASYVAPTSTTFTTSGNLNNPGDTYVAYIFAHDAGGFGLTGTDNVISCGSVTLNGSGAGSVTLGYEPQWVLLKNSQAAENWQITDNMRGMPVGAADALLLPNSSAAESSYDDIDPTSTGFNVKGLNSSQTYIYIAIRRGPMKVPTDGTTVYNAVGYTGTNVDSRDITNTFPPDFAMVTSRTDQASWVTPAVYDRLRGNGATLATNSTAAEAGAANTAYQGYFAKSDQTITGVTASRFGTWGYTNYSGGDPWISWYFKRAPSFFDEVCYTGTGAGTSQTHNLGVIPELKIIKSRSGVIDWVVGGSIISGVGGTANSMIFNTTAAVTVSSAYWAAADTSTTFSVRTGNGMSDGSGSTYIAYLFATCPGVSKVGSYTGTGTLTTINCGFTGGARFVLIKRTDSTSNWFLWDTVRGMTAGTDPAVTLNNTTAQVNANSVYTITTGFQLLATPSADVNTNGGSYIYLAIA